MDALQFSRMMQLNRLPRVIDIPDYLIKEIRDLLQKGQKEHPPAELNALVCYNGRYYLGNPALQSGNASTTDHNLSDRVGLVHSHPKNSSIDVNDFNQMLEPDRRIENFSMVIGANGSLSALFKTIESATKSTGEMKMAQQKYSQSVPDVARCAFMGYYEGAGTLLTRVYPK